MAELVLSDAPVVLAFVIPGLPEAQGSTRAFVVKGRARVTSTNGRLKSWRRDAIAAAQDARRSAPTLTGPVSLRCEFRFPRPQGHFGTGRNAGALKAAAPYWKASAPDCDKLVRSLLDALTMAEVWRDDAQVVSLLATKVYGTPGVSVSVRPADEVAL